MYQLSNVVLTHFRSLDCSVLHSSVQQCQHFRTSFFQFFAVCFYKLRSVFFLFAVCFLFPADGFFKKSDAKFKFAHCGTSKMSVCQCNIPYRFNHTEVSTFGATFVCSKHVRVSQTIYRVYI